MDSGQPPHGLDGSLLYAHGAAGSPLGLQVNLLHIGHVQPFITSGGGFLYFNLRMFGTKQQFNFTVQFGGGVQLFNSSLRVFGLQVPPYFQRQSGPHEPGNGIAHAVRRRVLLPLSSSQQSDVSSAAPELTTVSREDCFGESWQFHLCRVRCLDSSILPGPDAPLDRYSLAIAPTFVIAILARRTAARIAHRS